MGIKLEALSTDGLKLFEKFKLVEWLADYYLVGGTALALQIGHRISVDFDFFSSELFSNQELVERLKELGEVKGVVQDVDTLHCAVDGVRVTWLREKSKVFDVVRVNDNLKLASVKDIACFKLMALAGRGARKDFVDLFYVLRGGLVGFEELWGLLDRKYGQGTYNQHHLARSLVYFDDAEEDPEPNMLLGDCEWSEVKKFFKELVRKMK